MSNGSSGRHPGRTTIRTSHNITSMARQTVSARDALSALAALRQILMIYRLKSLHLVDRIIRQFETRKPNRHKRMGSPADRSRSVPSHRNERGTPWTSHFLVISYKAMNAVRARLPRSHQMPRYCRAPGPLLDPVDAASALLSPCSFMSEIQDNHRFRPSSVSGGCWGRGVGLRDAAADVRHVNCTARSVARQARRNVRTPTCCLGCGQRRIGAGRWAATAS